MRLSLTVCLIASFGLAGSAQAQDKFPSKPVKILTPYGPGGATDIGARVIGEQLRTILGQTFITENKPGAFGILALDEMMRAKHDGYTLMSGNNTTNAVTPIVYEKKLSFDYLRDVTPITRVLEVPSFLVVTPSLPVRSVPKLIKYAKDNPGKLRYGTVGVGSYPHYDQEIFVRRAGIQVNHIPIKSGAAGLLRDIATGDVQVGSINVATALPMVRSGQVISIAVSSPRRLPDYPDMPTMAELGFGEASTIQWIAFFAPSSVPKDVLQTLHKAVVEAVNSPGATETFKKNIMFPAPHASLEEASAWLRQEVETWRRKTTEVKLEAAE
jgi:tripartite-type tricarboxylate transporter receptor subunit TctC